MAQSNRSQRHTLQSPIGLIAGNGAFPIYFARGAKRQGLQVVAVAHVGETDPELANEVDQIFWVHLGALGKIIKIFRRTGVRQVAMAGGITRARLSTFRPDLRAVRLIARLRTLKDDALLRGIAGELESSGVEVFSGSHLVPESVAVAGVLTKRSLTETELRDALVGWDAARCIGAADVGQCVVVHKRTVVAVEAIEGTDATIRRAGVVIGAGTTVVKIAKPTQDLRFDLPTVGIQTMEIMQEAGATALVLEADRCMILDPDRVRKRADEARIAVEVFQSREGITARLKGGEGE